jgi:Phage Mu protein F like protein
LLRDAARAGLARYTALCAKAARRLLARPARKALAAEHLFTADEQRDLADALAGAMAPADLLGRARVRELTSARSQESGVRSQESGVKSQWSEVRFLTPDPCLLTPGRVARFAQGEPCKPGETAATSGCTPAGPTSAVARHGYTQQQVRDMTPGKRKALARRAGVDTKGQTDEQLTARLSALAQDAGPAPPAPVAPAAPAARPATRFLSRDGGPVDVPLYGRQDARSHPQAPAMLAAVKAVENSPQYRSGSLPMQAAYEAARGAAPGLTLEDFHRQVLAWQQGDRLALKASNDTSLQSADELRHGLATRGAQGYEKHISWLNTFAEKSGPAPAALAPQPWPPGQPGSRQAAAAVRFAAFAEPIPAAPTPEAALAYFRRLVPSLDRDPQRYGADLRRRAFTAAEATDATLLDHLQEIIAGWIETGEPTRGAEAIAEALDRAGVSPANPSYSELVFRTNVADAYNTGAWEEFTDPDVAEEFPAWEYHNPADSRSRPHHAARSGNVYPNSISFNEVRGTDIGDVANCRCTFLPLHKSEYQAAERAGRVQRFSEVDMFGEKMAEGKGDCKPGERADLTGCTPAGGRGEGGAQKVMNRAEVEHDLRQAGVRKIAGHGRLTDGELSFLVDTVKSAAVKPKSIQVIAGKLNFGQVHPLSGQMQISAQAMDQARLDVALKGRSESMADPTPRGVINHELGHVLHAKVGVPKALYDDPEVRSWSAKLSGQAALHPDEAVAEWYAAYMAGKDVHPKVEQWLTASGVTRAGQQG